MIVERMEVIPENEEPLEEGEQEIEGVEEEVGGQEPGLEHEIEPMESQEPPLTPARGSRGKVQRLTDLFNIAGGSGTPKTPSKTKAGGNKKPPRIKNKTKIDEHQRSKMEEAMRKFLNKAPD